MDKIIKIALEGKGFNEEIINSIIEVAAATGNSIVAIEKLLGIYEAPNLLETCTPKHLKYECTLIKYNEFKEEVEFSYQNEKTRGGYFTKDIKLEDINKDNFDDLVSPSDVNNTNCYYRYIPTGQYETAFNRCDLEYCKIKE